jgi:hypothetical protein
MPVSRGEYPNLDHLMLLMEHDQLSAVIVGHLIIESLLVKFLEMQQGANIDSILGFNFPMKVDRCVAGGLIRSELGEFLKVLNRQRNNFAHRLGHRISFEEAFALVREAAIAGIDFSDEEIHTSEAASRDRYGAELIIVEIFVNAAQEIGFDLMDRGLEYPFS